MKRAKAALALLLFLSSVAAPLLAAAPAIAGTAADPDMTDSTGDSVSGRSARDLVSGWVINETESSIELDLHTSTLEPFTPSSDWQSLPVVYYEFFFDVVTPLGSGSFSAKATIPMHGPLASFATYELYTVAYAPGGTVLNETVLQTVNGRYIVNTAVIAFTVDKSLIGDPARGDTLEGIWARTQSASSRGASDPITEDTMASHLAPGRSFTFTGGTTFYAITIATNTTSANASSDDPGRFLITIHSDSEKTANVTLRNASALPANWTLSSDKPFYAVDPGQNVTAILIVTPGGNLTNITRRVTVSGQYRDDQNGTRSSENTITLSIYVPLASKPGGGNNNPGSGGGGGFPFALIAGLAVVAAVIGGVLFLALVFLPGRRRAAAQTSFNKIAQLRLAKGPRSGPLAGGRPGMPPPPPPPPLRPMGPPGPPPFARPGPMPPPPPPRPVPRRR